MDVRPSSIKIQGEHVVESAVQLDSVTTPNLKYRDCSSDEEFIRYENITRIALELDVPEIRFTRRKLGI